jgi:acetyl esterase/lipase
MTASPDWSDPAGAGAAACIDDWDDAYANRANIADAGAVIAGWERDAPAFRARLIAAGRARLDLPYGDGARERWDLFLPEGVPHGLAVFIHGGYWMTFDKSTWSHLADGPLARGWAVAMPGYPLAPKASVAQITRSIVRFLASAAQTVAGPIALAGHSAGGHLATRMLCRDVALAGGAAERIARTVSISGVHDLRPLLRTQMNETLKLTPDGAREESPALLEPRAGVRLIAWVGGDERPEFIRQSALIANMWTGLGAATRSAVAPGRHHFDVIAGLQDPRGALTEALLGGL